MGMLERSNMTRSEIARVSREVAAAYDEAVTAYEKGLQRNNAQRFADAAPGSTLQIGTRINDEQISQSVIGAIGEAREKAMHAITRGLAGVEKKLTDPPSEEGARYIVSIQGRDDMTEQEIAAGLSRYTDHATQHAIRAAAKRSGVKRYAGYTDAEQEAAAYRALSGKVGEYFSLYAIESGQGVRNQLVRQTIVNIGDGVEPGSIAELNSLFNGE